MTNAQMVRHLVKRQADSIIEMQERLNESIANEQYDRVEHYATLIAKKAYALRELQSECGYLDILDK